MRQKACWRLLLRAVDAGSEHVATCGRKLGASGRVLPYLGQGGALPLQGMQGFMGVRYYAAPLSKTLNTPGKRSESKVEPEKDDRRVNRAVVARTIRLVSEDGKGHEIVTRQEALQRAQLAGLDLVEVDGKVDPVVCKLMNYKMQKFKEKKREKDLRKNQLGSGTVVVDSRIKVEKRRLDEIKEIRYSFKTEQKDLEIKAETATRMLERGHRVKVTILLQGKPADADPAVQLQKMINLLQDISKIEAGPRLDQNRTWVLLRPKISKQVSKAAGHRTKVVEKSTEILESNSEYDSDSGSIDDNELEVGGDNMDEEDDRGHCNEQRG